MDDTVPDTREERPVLITCLCIIGTLFTLIDLVTFALVPEAVNYTIAFHHLYFHWLIIITDCLSLIAYLGLWWTRLWGAILFIVVNVSYFFIGNYLSISGINAVELVINILLFMMLLPHLKDLK